MYAQNAYTYIILHAYLFRDIHTAIFIQNDLECMSYVTCSFCVQKEL